MTKRARIIQAVAARLLTITRVNGFETDAGLSLSIGAVSYGPDDGDLKVALLAGDSIATGSRQLPKKPRELPLHIAVVLRRWRDESWQTIEAAMGDVKRAVETSDATLGGLLLAPLDDGEELTLDVREGSTAMGFAIVYRAKYVETWGHP